MEKLIGYEPIVESSNLSKHANVPSPGTELSVINNFFGRRL